MVTGTTTNGFSYQIPDDALDDYELLEALTSVDNGNSTDIFVVVNLLLGKDQLEDLKKHLRKNGRVSAKAVIATVTEILQNCRQGKNC